MFSRQVVRLTDRRREMQCQILTRVCEIPDGLQARLAARGGIGVETVLNRYVAGSHVLQGFITEEAQPYPAIVLTRALDLLSSSLPAMVRVAGDAHKAERERPPL